MPAIFRNRPAELTRQDDLYLDAVEVLVPAARLAYARLVLEAARYSGIALEESADEEKSHLGQALLSDMVSFIGTMQRLRLVVARLPGKPVEVRVAKRAFDASVRTYEDARHHFEHMDEAIPRIAPTGQGAFGGISWWTPPDGDGRGTWTGFVSGTLAVGRKTLATRAPSSIRGPADHFWTVIAGDDYDITAEHDALTALEGRLRAIYI